MQLVAHFHHRNGEQSSISDSYWYNIYCQSSITWIEKAGTDRIRYLHCHYTADCSSHVEFDLESHSIARPGRGGRAGF